MLDRLPTDTEATANVQAGMDVLMREKAREWIAENSSKPKEKANGPENHASI